MCALQNKHLPYDSVEQAYIEMTCAEARKSQQLRKEMTAAAREALYLQKLERIEASAIKRAEEHRSRGYMLEAKAQLLQQQQQDMQATLQEIEEQQADYQRRAEFNAAQVSHNGTQHKRAQVSCRTLSISAWHKSAIRLCTLLWSALLATVAAVEDLLEPCDLMQAFSHKLPDCA